MRIRTRLAELEKANGVVDVGDNQLLVQLLGRRDALFWPWRHHGDSRLGVHQKQRQYLDGSVGIGAKADGKINWKAMFEARQRLISGGFLSALYSGGQVTSLFVTPLGEATARALVGSRLFSIRESLICYVMLQTDKWTSESEMFGENLLGDPSSWDYLTEIILPCLTSGIVQCNSDNVGRIGYKKTSRELPKDVPSVSVECDPEMDAVYIAAFNSERSSLQQCIPSDNNEVLIPISASGLGVCEPTQYTPPPKDAAMPQSVHDDLYGAENGN
jgi:hypothetical protein